MSLESVVEILDNLPKGCYPHQLINFVNGNVTLTRNKKVKLTIEIDIESLGSPHDDVHAVLSPFDNKLVPVLMFVEPAVYAAEVASGEQP